MSEVRCSQAGRMTTDDDLVQQEIAVDYRRWRQPDMPAWEALDDDQMRLVRMAWCWGFEYGRIFERTSEPTKNDAPEGAT